MSPRLAFGLLAASAMLLSACGGNVQQPSKTTPAPFDVSVLRNALDGNDLLVTASQTATQGVFSRIAQYQPLEVTGRPLQAYWFPAKRDAQVAASLVHKDGRTIDVEGKPVPVQWKGDPHFFLRDRVMVIYLSQPDTRTPVDTRVLHVLTEEMGPQFAGAK